MFCTAWCKEQSFTKASVYIPLSLPLTFLYFILPSSSSFPLPFFIPCLLIYSLILHPLPFPLLSFFLFLPSSPPSLPLLHFSHPFSFLLFFFVPDSLHYALCLPSPAPSFPTFLSACLLSLPSPPRPLPPSFSPLHCLHASPSSFLLSNLHHGPLLLFFLLPLPLRLSSSLLCSPSFLPPCLLLPLPSFKPSPWPSLSDLSPFLSLLTSPLPSFAFLPSFALLPSSLPPPPSFQTFTLALSFWPFSLPLPPRLSSSLFHCLPSSPPFLPWFFLPPSLLVLTSQWKESLKPSWCSSLTWYVPAVWSPLYVSSSTSSEHMSLPFPPCFSCPYTGPKPTVSGIDDFSSWYC